MKRKLYGRDAAEEHMRPGLEHKTVVGRDGVVLRVCFLIVIPKKGRRHSASSVNMICCCADARVCLKRIHV